MPNCYLILIWSITSKPSDSKLVLSYLPQVKNYQGTKSTKAWKFDVKNDCTYQTTQKCELLVFPAS